MKIEVGKKYTVKNDSTIKYVMISDRKDSASPLVFVGVIFFKNGRIENNGFRFTEAGRYHTYDEDEWDLVAEYVEEKEEIEHLNLDGSASTYFNSEVKEESEQKAKRHNSGKIRPSLFSPVALLGAAKVSEMGAKKYGVNNWRNGEGLDILEIIDSMDRHKIKLLVGETIDNESGLPHVDHILWNAMALSEQYHLGKMKRDSRYLSEDMLKAVRTLLGEAPEEEEKK